MYIIFLKIHIITNKLMLDLKMNVKRWPLIATPYQLLKVYYPAESLLFVYLFTVPHRANMKCPAEHNYGYTIKN